MAARAGRSRNYGGGPCGEHIDATPKLSATSSPRRDAVGVRKLAIDQYRTEGLRGANEAIHLIVQTFGNNHLATFADDQVVESVKL
jgi:hypothetical protein